jgi:hypothetical protein
MSNLQKRGNYVPRSQRQRQAYQMVVLGSGAGVAGVVTLALAVAGVIGAFLPIVLFIVAGVSAWRFRRVTGQS